MAKQGRIVEFMESGHAPFIEEGPKYRGELIAFLNSLTGIWRGRPVGAAP